MFTGPSREVKRGSTIELTCFTMTRQHHPAKLKVRNQDSGIDVTPENISLPNGEWHMGIVVTMIVSPDDGGNYTCEAVWENPNYTRTAAYTMKVTCKYSNNG